MIAFVICVNDSIEGVVLNDEQRALQKMGEIADNHFKTIHHGCSTREEYDNLLFWHLHETETI